MIQLHYRAFSTRVLGISHRTHSLLPPLNLQLGGSAWPPKCVGLSTLCTYKWWLQTQSSGSRESPSSWRRRQSGCFKIVSRYRSLPEQHICWSECWCQSVQNHQIINHLNHTARPPKNLRVGCTALRAEPVYPIIFISRDGLQMILGLILTIVDLGNPTLSFLYHWKVPAGPDFLSVINRLYSGLEHLVSTPFSN